MNYARDLERIRDLVNRAKLAAWGPRMVPVEGTRKVRIPATQASGEEMSYGGNTRTIELVVKGDGTVWHNTGDGEDLFDETILPKPAFSSTWAPSLFKSLVAKLTGTKPESQENGVNGSSDSSETEASDAAISSGIEKSAGKKRKGGKRK
ncbi:hypothetical protein BN14_01523 [Rhizoctonia solani AG-1 IB]|uniref:Uncharacterized protein n=1 Tax=Thanatephorus cucumeris (strain AG1-IB / isolate 7/3/14) TaxID=1108050 RepID=M5BUX4_THACB|nr:hypothetical protein BN14_01523 [Rhizoctonia solani AG-1 IB]